MSETQLQSPETETSSAGESVPVAPPKRKAGRPLGAEAAKKRAFVLEKHAAGWALQAISEEVKMPPTQVWQMIKKARVAKEREAALSNPVVLDKYVRPELWADHGNEHMAILKSETAWCLEHMFGIPRGLVSLSFLERARQTIELHYPKLRKSAVHVAADDADKKFFVQIPDWSKKRFDQIIRLCDLLETMTFDGHTSD